MCPPEADRESEGVAGLMMVGFAFALPTLHLHKDKLRGNGEGVCPPEADRGSGGVPQFPNLPP